MKLLKKLLLINWHYFSHQMIEFEQLNYMTGVNASGKSTIIDALQLVLFGDTAGRYFNKSASGKSARTLDSYLCGELSDNADGGYRYLRSGRFTSYVVTKPHASLSISDKSPTINLSCRVCHWIFPSSGSFLSAATSGKPAFLIPEKLTATRSTDSWADCAINSGIC